MFLLSPNSGDRAKVLRNALDYHAIGFYVWFLTISGGTISSSKKIFVVKGWLGLPRSKSIVLLIGSLSFGISSSFPRKCVSLKSSDKPRGFDLIFLYDRIKHHIDYQDWKFRLTLNNFSKKILDIFTSYSLKILRKILYYKKKVLLHLDRNRFFYFARCLFIAENQLMALFNKK